MRIAGDPNARRLEAIASRVTNAEKQQIFDAATRAGETVSDWLRRVALREAAMA